MSDSIFATAETAAERKRLVRLREQFAIHAPACPDWFQPEMLAAPEAPKLPDDLCPAAQHMAVALRVGQFVPQSLWADLPATDLVSVRKFEEALRLYRIRREEWTQQRRAQRLARWPWAWADAVLAERGER